MMNMPGKGYKTFNLKEEVYKVLELEAEKQHRPAGNLAQSFVIKGLEKLTGQKIGYKKKQAKGVVAK